MIAVEPGPYAPGPCTFPQPTGTQRQTVVNTFNQAYQTLQNTRAYPNALQSLAMEGAGSLNSGAAMLMAFGPQYSMLAQQSFDAAARIANAANAVPYSPEALQNAVSGAIAVAQSSAAFAQAIPVA